MPTSPLAARSAGALLAVALMVTAAGCDNGRRPQIERQSSSTSLVVSQTWVNTTQGTGTDPGHRIAALQHAIDDLRKETGTGWIGRQDDATGYLAELRGGSRAGSPRQLMDDYGDALFGIGSRALRFAQPDAETVPGMVSVRARQVVGAVPVLDGSLAFTSRAAAASGVEKVTEVRGRVFPGLSVATDPRLSRDEAVAIAEEASSGRHEGPPSLVVVPTGTGTLAWEVTVLAGSGAGFQAGNYYVDAVTGDVVGVRPISAELASPTHARSEPDPGSVEVTGADPVGNELTGHGLQTDAGVELTDTTTESWDPTTRTGGVSTYDASGIANESQLPGVLVTSADTRIRDADAIAAHVYSKDVLDYYSGLGRDSWDDRGSQAVSSVHFGPSDYCNAFFSDGLDPPQMVYANPCTRPDSLTASYVDVDVTGHEMTHGVTASSAGLIYSGQSGALNESFSDYFGNVIGDLVTGTDTVALGEEVCNGITVETRFCHENPDGTRSVRYLLNGNDFDQYLRVLNPGLRLHNLGLATQDQGGVHYNSAIWNNALWSIRTQLALIDGAPGYESELARAFDRAVYGALTTRLGPTSGFVDARAAVEQVIIDSGLDPVVLRVAQEVFDANKICVGCPTVGQLAGDTVTATPQAQLHPSVSGDLVAWLDMSAGEYVGAPASLRLGGTGPSLGAGDTWDVALAGEALVVLNGPDEVVRYDSAGSSVLARGRGDLVNRGLAGSDSGAAWAPTGSSLSFVDAAGAVSTTDITGLNRDPVISVGTGGGSVAAGTKGGKVLLWKPGGAVTEVGTMSGAVASVAPYGDNLLAISCIQEEPGRSVPTCDAKLFTADGRSYEVSDSATVLGAAMSEEYAVWPEEVGKASAGVAPGGTIYPDTDLYLLSLKTGRIYDLLEEPGQQGFPSLSGNRLVWQDATFGGDDILTAELPPGL
jgi:Zn-dependent metalloprotease